MVSEKKFALQTVGDTVVRNNQTNEIYWNHNLVHLINSLSKENEQLKSQKKVFELCLVLNDLDIEWDEFCSLEECAFDNPNFSCQDCIHMNYEGG